MTRAGVEEEGPVQPASAVTGKALSPRKLRAAGRAAAQADGAAALLRMADRAGASAGWSEAFAEGYAAELRRLAGRL